MPREGPKVEKGIYDFHTHSTLSDGELSPMELIREAFVRGYAALAITDHAGFGQLHRFSEELGRDCAEARGLWPLTSMPGVELTHLPPAAIDRAAREAKEAGAWVVVVHGETVSEPVEPGTNQAAIESEWVDVLAHPGLITLEEARLATANGTFLELSAKPDHGVTNGHVAKMAKQAGACLIVDSDNHALDFLSETRIRAVAIGAGLEESELEAVRITNPVALLERVLAGRAGYGAK
jgi:putative hydrolase